MFCLSHTVYISNSKHKYCGQSIQIMNSISGLLKASLFKLYLPFLCSSINEMLFTADENCNSIVACCTLSSVYEVTDCKKTDIGVKWQSCLIAHIIFIVKSNGKHDSNTHFMVTITGIFIFWMSVICHSKYTCIFQMGLLNKTCCYLRKNILIVSWSLLFMFCQNAIICSHYIIM